MASLSDSILLNKSASIITEKLGNRRVELKTISNI